MADRICTSKETISRIKRQPDYTMERVFPNKSSEQGILSMIYKELQKLITVTLNQPVNKWVRGQNSLFSK